MSAPLRARRSDGRIVIEIPESRVLALAKEALAGRATVTDTDRLLEAVVGLLAGPGRSGREGGEAPIERFIGDAVAEAAHAKAGIQWNDPDQHMLLHQ